MPVKNKNKVNQLISHLGSCLYIISGIVLLSTGRTALAIDYIEITNPKFIPVKVGVAIGAGTEADKVQKVFKANLDKVLYFQIIPETKQEYEDSENIVFYVELICIMAHLTAHVCGLGVVGPRQQTYSDSFCLYFAAD